MQKCDLYTNYTRQRTEQTDELNKEQVNEINLTMSNYDNE